MKLLHDLLALLNDLNPAFQALTLLALVVYVWKTWEMAKATSAAATASENALQEMRRSREQQSQPHVICYFRDIPASKFFELVVKNSGTTMAFDVQLAFTPPLENYNEGQAARTLPSKSFKALAPGYEWRTLWGSFVGLNDPAVPEEITVRISYRWGRDRRSEEYDLSFDVRSLMGKWYLPEASIEQSLAAIGKSLDEIRGILSNRAEDKNA